MIYFLSSGVGIKMQKELKKETDDGSMNEMMQPLHYIPVSLQCHTSTTRIIVFYSPGIWMNISFIKNCFEQFFNLFF